MHYRKITLTHNNSSQSLENIKKAIKTASFDLNSLMLLSYRFINDTMYKDDKTLEPYLAVMSDAFRKIVAELNMIQADAVDGPKTK